MRDVKDDPTELKKNNSRDRGSLDRASLLSNRIFSPHIIAEDSRARIPVNPVCSDQIIKSEQEALSLLIFPTDKRNWKEPIIFRGFDKDYLERSFKRGVVDLNLVSVPDGEYLFAMNGDC